jgi:hypothetical protein
MLSRCGGCDRCQLSSVFGVDLSRSLLDCVYAGYHESETDRFTAKLEVGGRSGGRYIYVCEPTVQAL